MFMRALIGSGIVVAGGYAAYTGTLPGNGPAQDTRLVAHPVAEVYAAIADLNVAASEDLVPAEGLMNMFVAVPMPAVSVEPGKSVRWDFFAGDTLAETIVATLEPAVGGAATRIVTTVTDHALPAGATPPSVSVPGGMKGMFDLALGQELGPLDPGLAAQARQQLAHLKHDAAMQAATAIALHPMAIGMAGTRMEYAMRTVPNDIDAAAKAQASKQAAEILAPTAYDTDGPGAVRFTPGKPMVDPRRR